MLEHISAWFEQADAGWPEDRPDLDLERYFQQSDDTRLYLYDDLAPYSNGFVRFRPARNNTMRIGRGTASTKSAKRSKHRFGYIADVGDIDVPPRTWTDISARAAAPPSPPLGRSSQIDPWIVDRLIDRLGTQVASG